MEDLTPRITPSSHTFAKKILNIFFAICFFLIFCYYTFASPLNANSVRIHISTYATLGSVSQELEARLVVRHAVILKILVYIFSGDKAMSKGDYVFAPHTSVFSIAWDIARGHHNVAPIRVTLKEGSTMEQIARVLADNLDGFRKDLFLEKTNDMQGMLFPDTYFFYSLSDADEIISDIKINFTKRIAPFRTMISAYGHTEHEILTMASLIQKEALGKEDAPTIAGILWKRISLDMPLQVDAYRSTYTQKGLPENPIGNPGLVAIQASINPVESPYLYYLHDKNGMVHYAITYTEHLHNIQKYLK